ncbi:hypothetical protein [Kribbella sp. NPDC051770]|uniref:hypothetical protein n=1 Tax=Kribbella sp. NPDC051770 TaxID=3155413 RepID=UPI00342594CB
MTVLRSHRIVRPALWMLGVLAGTAAAAALSTSSASAATGPADRVDDHRPAANHRTVDARSTGLDGRQTADRLSAKLRATSDALDPLRDRVARPAIDEVVRPVADRVVRPTVDKVARPVVDEVTRPVVGKVLKPVTDQILRPATDQVAKPVVTGVLGRKAPVAEAPATSPVRPGLVDHVASPAVTAPIPASPRAESAKTQVGTRHSVPAQTAALAHHLSSGTAQKLAAGETRDAAFTTSTPAGPVPAPALPGPTAPSAPPSPTQVLSSASGSTIAKKFAVLGGTAAQRFAVTGPVAADDDLIGPAPGTRPGTTPD